MIDGNIINGALHTYGIDIDRGLPVALLFKHRFSKAFGQPTTSIASQLLSPEEDQDLIGKTRHVSDTGEIILDVSVAASEHFIVDTPKNQSITGFITDKTLSATNLSVMVTAETYKYGSVSLQPLDDKTITDSKDMLLTVVSRQHNTGEFKNANNGLTARGTAPVLMQPLEGQIDISTDLTGISNVKVNQLDVRGKVKGQLPVTLDTVNGKISVSLTGLSTPYLQVVKQSVPLLGM
jgi:hypothetical protein